MLMGPETLAQHESLAPVGFFSFASVFTSFLDGGLILSAPSRTTRGKV